MVAVTVVCWALETTAAAAQQAGQPGQIQLRDDKFSPYREYATRQVVVRSYPNWWASSPFGRIDRQSGKVTTLSQGRVRVSEPPQARL